MRSKQMVKNYEAKSMLFKIGIEKPESDEFSYGIVIPALCNDKYAAFSASDNFDDIVDNARDAAFSIMGEMIINSDLNLAEIARLNKKDYSSDPEYADFTEWAFVDIEIDSTLGKQKELT